MDEIDKLHVRMQGMKCWEVCRIAGMDNSTLSRVLNRKGSPRLDTVDRINKALDRMGAKNA